MSINQTVIDRLWKEQGGTCKFCGRVFRTIEDAHVHHAIIPKGQTNYKKYKKWLDMAENLALVCWQCDYEHGYLTNDFVRDCIWTDKINAGYDMEKWYADIPMIDKAHRFLYLKEPERQSYRLLAQVGENWKRKHDK